MEAGRFLILRQAQDEVSILGSERNYKIKRDRS
jgi:hypothetical protein